MPTVADILDRAIAEGRHSPAGAWRTVCDGCGEWVGGIWHVTPDKNRLCIHCAASAGVQSAIDELAKRGEPSEPRGAGPSHGAPPRTGQLLPYAASQAAGGPPVQARAAAGVTDARPRPGLKPTSTAACPLNC